MKHKLFSYMLVFAFPLTQTNVLISAAAAQAGQAELTGEVRDRTGAAITSVRVTLTAVETKQAITGKQTNPDSDRG